MYILKKPILFIIFNREDTTKLVFEQIRNAKPPRLYIAADGHRKDREGEDIKCLNTRNIVENIDWECEIFTRFSDSNLGMKVAEYTAMNWFFENEEDGIILEDDTYPSISFFRFCEEMLEFYKYDTRIFHIAGCNLQFGKSWGDGSYYFSTHPTSWGWASWRRAWKYYDPEVKNLPRFKEFGHMKDIMVADKNKWLYKWIINSIYKGRNTWDYQWSFAILSQHGLCVTPNKSLITNLGFRPDATTSTYSKTKLSEIKLSELDEIIHPTFMVSSVYADYYFNKLTLSQVPIILRVYNKLLKIIKLKFKVN